MDIKLFITALLGVSAIAYFIPVENMKKVSADKDIPLVIFEKPLMYTLTQEGVNRIIKSSQAVRYNSRDELFDANILIKNEEQKKDFQIEKFNADIIIKKDNLYKLVDNVEYQRDSFVSLKTNQMFYNDDENIVYNSKPFEGYYYDSKLKGTDLYLDLNNKTLNAKNTHFEIDMKKK
mgnify:CR=1 FL=1